MFFCIDAEKLSAYVQNLTRGENFYTWALTDIPKVLY